MDGVYDKDPHQYSDAVRYETIRHDQVLQMDQKVMDATAAPLCRDNHMPIGVFCLDDPENIVRMVCGEPIGTLIR